jgi:hypothetical protein
VIEPALDDEEFEALANFYQLYNALALDADTAPLSAESWVA